jgi:hypothetical protein
MDAIITASLALHGRAFDLASVAYGCNRPPLRRCSAAAMISKKLTRNASRSRKMVANAMRNMQIPAYCPVVLGVNVDDQREVPVDVKNTMVIGSMSAIVVVSEGDVDMDMEELSVELAMIMSIELMSILAIWRVYLGVFIMLRAVERPRDCQEQSSKYLDRDVHKWSIVRGMND